MAHLELQTLSKSFGSTVAVRNVSLAIEAGEFVSLLGPSGCGKSSLLRLIAGLEAPDDGRILLGGNDITAVVPQKRGIGLVFQNYALFPHMTVERNVAFGLEGRENSQSSIRSRVDRMLEAVRLSSKRSRPVTDLSGGEQQRVAVARALVVEPSVLLFDEPLSNLDVALRQSTREEIRALQRRTGITTVYVTHDQAEALSMADRVAVMQAGKIEQIGSPSELYDRPASSFVATFLGGANLFIPGGDIRIPDVLAGRVRPGSVIAVKPERIRVVGSSTEGMHEGIVVEREYLGFLTTLLIRIGSTDLHATVPSGDLPQDLKPGNPIWFDINWSRAVVCDASSQP